MQAARETVQHYDIACNVGESEAGPLQIPSGFVMNATAGYLRKEPQSSLACAEHVGKTQAIQTLTVPPHNDAWSAVRHGSAKKGKQP